LRDDESDSGNLEKQGLYIAPNKDRVDEIKISKTWCLMDKSDPSTMPISHT